MDDYYLLKLADIEVYASCLLNVLAE